MELQPADSASFRQAIEGLKDFLPDAQLMVTSAGLTIYGMDGSHIGYVKYTLAAADCAVLKVHVPQALGVPLSTLSRVLGSIGPNDAVTLKSSDTALIISFTNEKLKKKVDAKIPLLDLDVDALDIPEQTYAATIQMKTVDLTAAFKDVAPFGDAITLLLDEEGFHVEAKSEMGAMSQLLENTDDREMTRRAILTEPVGFGTKYMLSMLRCSLSQTLELDFDPATPMRLSYKYGRGSSLVFHLAPKMADTS
jgi:proliferating cell nuclear antigen PCNA